MAPGACLMGISRNARSLPDFPEFAQQLGMVSPELADQVEQEGADVLGPEAIG